MYMWLLYVMPVMHLTVMPVMHLTAMHVMHLTVMSVMHVFHGKNYALPALFKKCQRKKLLALTCMHVMSIAGTNGEMPRKKLEAYR
jgi:hypothetical protein